MCIRDSKCAATRAELGVHTTSKNPCTRRAKCRTGEKKAEGGCNCAVESEAAKAADNMNARDAHNGKSAYASHVEGRHVEGRCNEAAVGPQNSAVTWTCTCGVRNKAAKAATKRNAREAEEERYKAAEAATGISANDKHAQQ